MKLSRMLSENQGRMQVEKCPIFPQNKLPMEPVAFFPKEIHSPMRNEKLRKVIDFGDPNLNIESTALVKPIGGEARHSKNRVNPAQPSPAHE